MGLQRAEESEKSYRSFTSTGKKKSRNAGPRTWIKRRHSVWRDGRRRPVNMSIFYLTVSVLALGCLWFLWQFGVRPLLLDNFRDAVFAQRDELYALAQSGRIQCESAAYRTVEKFLNGVIRYAHRFTFSSLVLGHLEMDKARERGDFVDFSKEMFLEIEAVGDPFVKQELSRVVSRVGNLIPRFVAKSSLLFMMFALVYLAVRLFQPMLASDKKKEAVSAWEREAHLAATSDEYAVA